MAALLGEVGFESFAPTTNGILAYIQTTLFDEEAVQNDADGIPVGVRMGVDNAIADQNWNEEWEKHYFQPIVVDDECVIHSSFTPMCRMPIPHIDRPEDVVRHGTPRNHYQILKEIRRSRPHPSVLDMVTGQPCWLSSLR